MNKKKTLGPMALIVFCVAVLAAISVLVFDETDHPTPITPIENDLRNVNSDAASDEIVADIDGDRGQPYEPDKPDEVERSLGHIDGLVRNNVGRPIEDARISIVRNRGVANRYALRETLKPIYLTRSDKDGAFSFGPLYAGSGYAVLAEHDEFAGETVENISIPAGERVTLSPIVLKSGLAVHGWVRDSRGRPIVAARLVLLGGGGSSALPGAMPGTSQHGLSPNSERTTNTDEEGHYRFTNIARAGFSVNASAPGYESKTEQDSTPFSGPSDTIINFALLPEKTITGQVVDPFGEPIEGALVQAFRPQGPNRAPCRATSAADGAFRVENLGTGLYRLSVSHDHFSTTRKDRVAAGSVGVVVELPRRTGLSGRVVDPGGTPVRKFSINVKRAPKPGDRVETGIRRKYNHKNGRFVIEGLDPGNYILEAAARGFAVTSSKTIEVTRDSYADAGAIGLTRGGSLGGVVVDPAGDPLKGAVITLRQNEYRPSRFEEVFGSVNPVHTRPTVTDGKGAFSFDAITPGAYQVEVRHKNFPTLRFDNNRIEDEAAIDMGALRLARGGTLEGRVCNEQGAFIAGARIRIEKADQTFIATVTADSEGAYSLSPVPPGVYTLTPEFPLTDSDNPFGLAPPADDCAKDGIELAEGATCLVNLVLRRKRM